MHGASNFSSERSILIQLFKSIFLDCLEIVKIDVYPWTFYSFLLCEVGFLEVIVLNRFPIVFLIVQIINSMAKAALLLAEDAETSHEESTQGLLPLLFNFFLFLDQVDLLIFSSVGLVFKLGCLDSCFSFFIFLLYLILQLDSLHLLLLLRFLHLPEINIFFD